MLGGAHELTPQKLLALRQVANVERSLTSSNSSAETGTECLKASYWSKSLIKKLNISIGQKV